MSPESSYDPQKEIIRNQSLLLKAFLDKNQLSNFKLWLTNLEKYSDPIEGEINDNLGQHCTDLSIDMLLISADNHNIFPKKLPERITPTIFNRIVKTIFLIGHEIGVYDDTKLFLKDILVILAKLEMLHPNYTTEDRIKEKTASCIKGFMDSGVYIREYYSMNEAIQQEDVKVESPVVNSSIIDFINNIPDNP